MVSERSAHCEVLSSGPVSPQLQVGAGAAIRSLARGQPDLGAPKCGNALNGCDSPGIGLLQPWEQCLRKAEQVPAPSRPGTRAFTQTKEGPPRGLLLKYRTLFWLQRFS